VVRSDGSYDVSFNAFVRHWSCLRNKLQKQCDEILTSQYSGETRHDNFRTSLQPLMKSLRLRNLALDERVEISSEPEVTVK